MKAADVKRAQAILDGLVLVERERLELGRGVQRATIQCHNGSYVAIPIEAATQLALKSLDHREASLRRAAAQIGLVLQ